MLFALTDPRDVYEPAGAAPGVGQGIKGIKGIKGKNFLKTP